jgi:hypothetical protein
VAREAKVVYTAEDRTGPATASAKAGLMSVKEAAAIAGFQLASLGSAATLAGIVAMVKKAAEGVDALNDIRDATGATVENISALERVQMQYGHAQGTATTSLIKFNQALQATVKPGSDAEKVIAALGLNAKQLRDMDPAEALRETAIALNRYADDGAKARAVQELFGKSLREVAPFLKDLAESGELVATVTTKQAEEAEKFNRELFKLQGNVTILAREMANPLITTVNEFIQSLRDAQKEGEGFGGTLLRVASVMPTFSNAGGAIGRWLREQFVGPEQLNGFTAARKAIDDINEALKDTSLREGERNALLRERVRLEGQLAGYLNSSAGAGRGTGGYSFAKTSLELPVIEQNTKKVAKAIKEASEAEKDWAYHTKHNREAQVKAVEAMFAGWKEEEQFRAREVAMAADAEQKILQRVYLLEQESTTFGMLESQVVRVTLRRLEDMRTAAAAGGENVDAVDRQIAAQQRLIAALEGKELRAANQQGADSAATSWASVGDAFVDNLMRGGKSVAQYLKDLFRTLVLRPILAPIGQAVSGVMGSMFGTTASAATGGAGGSSALGSLGNLASLGSLFGAGGLGGSVAAGMGWLTGASTLGGTFTAATSLMGTGTLAGTMSGAGMMLGAAAPFLLAAVAIYSLLKRKGGDKQDGVFGTINSGIGQGNRSSELGLAAQTTAGGIQSQFDSLARSLGLADPGVQFGVGISTDPKGDSPSFLDVTASRAGQTLFTSLDRNVGRSQEELQKALTAGSSRAILGALQSLAGTTAGAVYETRTSTRTRQVREGSAEGGELVDYVETITEQVLSTTYDAASRAAAEAASNIPRTIRDMLRGVDFASMSAEAADALLASITAVSNGVSTFRAAAQAWPVREIQALGFDTTAALVQFSGGIEQLLGNVTAYIDNFYTEGEKRAQSVKNITRILAAAGLTVTEEQVGAATRAQFRAIAEAQDLTTEAGQRNYAALMSVAGAFASLTETTGNLADTTGDAAAAVGDLVDAAERLAGINRRADSYAERFLTPSELQGYRTNQVIQSLGRAGINYTPQQVASATLQDVRQLFEYMGQLGDMDAQEAILDAVDAFLALKDAAASGAETTQDLARRIQDLGKGVFEYVRDLKATRGGTASALDLLTGTGNNYRQDLALARANDPDALARITNTAQAYIEAAKGYGASGPGTQAIIDRVIAELGALPATQSYEQQILLTLGTISDTLDLTQANTLLKLEAMLTKSEVTQKTMAAILSRLSEDSILSYGKAEVSAIYGAIEFNTRRTAELLAAMGAVGGITLGGGTTGSTPPPGAAAGGATGGTTGDTTTDAQRFAQELALYEQLKGSGKSIYQAANDAAGWDAATVDAWLTRTGLPAFERGTPYIERGGLALLHPAEAVMTAGDNRGWVAAMREVAAEVRLLRQENAALRAENAALVRHEVAANGRKIDALERVAEGVDKLADGRRGEPVAPRGVVRA